MVKLELDDTEAKEMIRHFITCELFNSSPADTELREGVVKLVNAYAARTSQHRG